MSTQNRNDRMNQVISAIAIIVMGVCLTANGQMLDPFPVSAELSEEETGMVLSVSFTVPDQHYLYENSLKIEAPEEIQLVPKNIPQAKQKYDDVFKKILGLYDHDMTFVYLLKGVSGYPVDLTVKYLGCKGGLCFPPAVKTLSISPGAKVTGVPKIVVDDTPSADTAPSGDWKSLMDRFTMVARSAGYMNPKQFIAFLDNAESGQGTKEDSLSDTFAKRGVVVSIIMIIFAGLALNLTPCVLPMIPINIAIIGAGAQASSRRRGFALGAAYGAGIAFVYGLLGVLAVLTKAQFGALNSSPSFNFGIAGIFFLMSLAMFGVFNLDFTRFQGKAGTGESHHGSLSAAFFLGTIAALLAGACVAPVVISVMLLSADLYIDGNRAGLFLPFLLGIGMALPWPFAGAGLSFLPKAGKWMGKIKYAFGAIILSASIYYGYLGYTLMSGSGEATKEGWLSSIDEALVTAQEEGKPVFIDFWASWCKACVKMEKITFPDPAVQQRLDSYIKLRFVAENQRDPKIKAVLDHFVKVGLPTYVILSPVKAGDR